MIYTNNQMRKLTDPAFTSRVYSSSYPFSTTENIGRYYVFIKTMEETLGENSLLYELYFAKISLTMYDTFCIASHMQRKHIL